MKKLVLICSVCFAVLAITACKSKDEVVDNSAENSAQIEAPVEEVVEEAAEEPVEEIEKKHNKKEKEKSGPKSKNYVGWLDKSAKDVVFKSGIIQIKVKPKLGTYTMGVLNERMKVVPILGSSDEFSTNQFYLKTSKKTYRLINENGVETGATRKKNGLCLSYNVPNTADVRINFDCFPSEMDSDNDVIKVTVSMTNIGKKKDDFSMKAIMDTILGEQTRNHFYSSEKNPINNEVCYRTMQNQRWFISKNENAAMQFIFDGAECTPTEIVALANFTTLQRLSWEPDMSTFRSFDNVLSYNNSAVEVIWPTYKLNPGESQKMVFYIALASDGNVPAGEKIIGKKEKTEEPKIDKEESVKKPEPVPAVVEVVKESKMEEVKLEESKPEDVKTETSEPEELMKEVPVSNPKNKLSEKQLTPEYIQNLIDRISAMEKDTSNVNQEELIQLNAELDAILNYLRQ